MRLKHVMDNIDLLIKWPWWFIVGVLFCVVWPLLFLIRLGNTVTRIIPKMAICNPRHWW